MHRLFFLLLPVLFCDLTVYGQLDGTYRHHYGLGEKEFTFHSDHTFSYSFSHCTGRTIGSGHYVQRWGKLTLYFETDTSCVHTVTSQTERISDVNDTTVIRLSIRENNEPGYYIRAVVIDSENNQQTLYSDIDGHACFQLTGVVFPCYVYVDSGENHPLLSKIGNAGVYIVDAQLPDRSVERYETDDIVRYTFKKNSDGTFDLRSEGSKQSVRFSAAPDKMY